MLVDPKRTCEQPALSQGSTLLRRGKVLWIWQNRDDPDRSKEQLSTTQDTMRL
jgi:hypothetical protein